MSDSLRQDKRVARLDTPLGKDKLGLVNFECTEGISEKFEIKIDAVSSSAGINFDQAIGQNCTITVDRIGSEIRYFDGVLAEARWLGGMDNDLQHYQLVLRPWLWLLSFRRNSFIYHEKTVPEIIEKVFGDHSFAVFSNNLSRGYPTLEYCVQYRESDMHFVCRLMEEYGISYYFKHSDGEHKLILTDEMSTFEAISGGSRPYLPTGRRHHSDQDYFHQWQPARHFTSGMVKVDAYDFKKSDQDMAVTENVSPPFEPGALEVFDYHDRYVESSDGQKIAQAWRDMERSKDHHFHAEGECVTCFPGALVTLEDKSDSSFGGDYLALRCVHRFSEQSYRSGTGGDAPPYAGRYEFVKSDKTYAPPRITPKAVIHGPQTAKVVGEGDIDVDEYGRILARFHWDQNEDQSRRVRVAEVWAGNKWGGIYTPRVGMEALVVFLEGDPDQPLVVGCVYNDKHMPPFDLPSDKTISGIKSNSTPSGNGYNEFIFDDKDGSELVRLHAQRNLESVIEEDESRTVKNDRNTEITQNDTLTVGQVLKVEVGTKIELICGGSKITMTPEKIAIQALQVDIQATDFKTNALTSSHSAGAVMSIQGTLVKIN